jgi:hypothetical protein
MATNYSVGHGMRRRSGIPSSYTEAAGKSMARSHQTSEEHYSDASAAGSVRIPIGAPKTYTGSEGTAVPRKNTQGGEVSYAYKQNRKNIERVGASYRIQPNVNQVVVDPAVGPTMRNARVVPSVQGRVAPNFGSAMQDASN